jgi:uncharacterized protein YchJ
VRKRRYASDTCDYLLVRRVGAAPPERKTRSLRNAFVARGFRYAKRTVAPDTRSDNLRREVERLEKSPLFYVYAIRDGKTTQSESFLEINEEKP